MAICQNCGQEVGDVKFCGNCGTEIAVEKEKKLCGNCGAELKDAINFCPKCGETVSRESAASASDKKGGVTPVSSINVVKINDDVTASDDAEKSVDSDDSSAANEVKTPEVSEAPVVEKAPETKTVNETRTNKKDPTLALILSFFVPGLGHLYAGLTGKGIIFFLLGLLCFIIFGSLLIFTGLFLSTIGIILYLFVWGFALYDSYVSCEKINNSG